MSSLFLQLSNEVLDARSGWVGGWGDKRRLVVGNVVCLSTPSAARRRRRTKPVMYM